MLLEDRRGYGSGYGGNRTELKMHGIIGIAWEGIGGGRVTRGGQPNPLVGWIHVGNVPPTTERGLKLLN
jgi:hypothetical protein